MNLALTIATTWTAAAIALALIVATTIAIADARDCCPHTGSDVPEFMPADWTVTA